MQEQPHTLEQWRSPHQRRYLCLQQRHRCCSLCWSRPHGQLVSDHPSRTHCVHLLTNVNRSSNPNVTGIVWANVPGEQSGNALVDILYGNANPGGKLPYTLGRARSDYGTDVSGQSSSSLKTMTC